MRALVAESNVITRVTLTRLLERAGFAVEELHDELAAVSLLYQPDPPELALLSLDTLIVDFAQICATMREAKPDVFIVALVPEARRNDLSDIVSQSADDFLIKPVTLQEAEARILITQRLLTARPRDGRSAPDAHPAGTAHEAAETAGKAASDGSAADQSVSLTAQLKAVDFADDFRTVFGQMGLTPIAEVEAEAVDDDFAYTAWAPMIVRYGHAAAWVDLRLDLSRESTERIFSSVVRKDRGSEAAHTKLLRDVMGLAQDGLKQSLAAQDSRVFAPILPSAALSDRFPLPVPFSLGGRVVRANGLRIGGDVSLRVSLVARPVEMLRRPVKSLRPLDILAAPLVTLDDQVMLMRTGTVMNEAYIEKIERFVRTQNVPPEIDVFRPPTTLSTLVHAHLDDTD